MSIIKFVFPILALSIVILSCEKIIVVDLNDVESKMVIEANVDDEGGPYQVRLSKTVNYNESNNFPAVTGAIVTLTDSEGNSEVLTESTAGYYLSTTIDGVSGRTYTLDIAVDGNILQSSSKMALNTPIDTILIEEGFFGSFRYLSVVYQDDPNEVNYYRFIKVINGITKKDINLATDQLNNGELVSAALFFFGSDSLKTGDQIEIIMHGIDKVNYDYLRTLNEVINQGVSATPANPLSPFSPTALGYFSAHSVSRKTIIIP